MFKSLMKECTCSKTRLMRSCIWNSLKVFIKILIRFSITYSIFRYNHIRNAELLSNILFSAVIAEIIIFTYTSIRGAIGKGNIHYHVYEERLIREDKFLYEDEYGPIVSYIKRVIRDLVFMVFLLFIYVSAIKNYEDKIGKENVQYIAIAVLSIPYILALRQIFKYTSYFYKAKSYIGAPDPVFNIHNDMIYMSNNCPEAPDVICNNKSTMLLLVIVLWPFRVFFGNIALVITKLLTVASYFCGYAVACGEVILLLFVIYKEIVPAVELDALTSNVVLSLWPFALLIIPLSIAAFFLIKYRFEIMDKMEDIEEYVTMFRYGVV